jgi:hypothetical protein
LFSVVAALAVAVLIGPAAPAAQGNPGAQVQSLGERIQDDPDEGGQ